MKGVLSMSTIQLFGCLLLLLFYGSYFGKLLLQRSQGISTDRMGRGSKPKRTYILEVILKLVTFSMAGVQIMSIVANNRWFLLVPNSATRYSGVVIALAGTILFVTAMVTMRSSWRAGVDATQQTELIVDGIYRISRNPAFLGFDLFYFGFALSFSNPVMLIFLILCMVMLHLQILEEEKYLTSVFGKDYITFRKTTGRYFYWTKRKMEYKNF